MAKRPPAWVEVKFNPWHDPANGRFTFANSGKRYGFGGGGAQAGWSAPKPPRARKPADVGKPKTSPDRSTDRTTTGSTATVVKPAVEPFRRVTKNGYDFEVDRAGKMRRASGDLTQGAENRSRRGQRATGGLDRRSTDDGGHYIARRFNGPPDDFNLFPQDANFNRGRYRVLEDQWARAKRAGKSVMIEIIPRFVGGSTRPSALDVYFRIDGELRSVKFQNERQEKPGGKR
ncbi:DNA/RNA non-specific endonuclease [Sphingomonas sp. 28-63-12]|uniref:DNA/RNA non-specific endonuclease n=1 Tax=Sphingomonas sp. 28-63-12 TaxID=1970434 RepID=UPI0035A94030